jgi:hypothetical protein
MLAAKDIFGRSRVRFTQKAWKHHFFHATEQVDGTAFPDKSVVNSSFPMCTNQGEGVGEKGSWKFLFLE